MSFAAVKMFAFALVSCVLLSGTGNLASGSIPADIASCDRAYSSQTMTDGSILLFGRSKLCTNGVNPPGHILLIKLRPNGTVDPAFSEGGVKVLQISTAIDMPVKVFPLAGGGFVLVTSSDLYKFTADGSFDTSFGGDGHVSTVDGPQLVVRDIRSAAQQADGRIVVAGGAAYNGVRVARFKANGDLDDSFAGDGVANPAVPPEFSVFEGLSGLGIDGEGRVVVAGDAGGKTVAALRLLPDGTTDTSFGPEADGFARSLDFSSSSYDLTVLGLYLGPDDGMSIVTTAHLTYQNSGFVARFDSNGNPVGSKVWLIGTAGSYVAIPTPDGGIVTSAWEGKGGTASFNVQKRFESGSVGFRIPDVDAVPGPENVAGISYDPSDDSLIATAYGSDDIEVAKLDDQTGKLDQSFGTGGVTLISEDSCSYGEAPALPQYLPQASPRCRFLQPSVSAKVHFVNAKSRRPAIVGSINLDNRLTGLFYGYLDEAATIRLPRILRLKSEKLRGEFSAKVSSPLPGRSSVTVHGRSLSVSFHPDHGDCCSIYDDGERRSGPVSIRFKIGSGVVKEIPRRLRHRSMDFKFGGITSSTPAQYDSVNREKFFAPSATTPIVVRVRPVRGS